MPDQRLKSKLRIAIFGSAMPGSTLALVLARLGFNVTVIEKGVHPRFAIGESSTPTADLYLRKLSEDFGIPELAVLSTYAETRREYPQLNVGIKRGFSYFWHLANRPYDSGPQHENELVVAASSSDQVSDSQWDRADIDSFLVSLFDRYGVEYCDQSTITAIQRIGDSVENEVWEIEYLQSNQKKVLRANYFIDASGKSGIGIRTQGGVSRVDELHTDTQAKYAHFRELKPWHEFISSSAANHHPFQCDKAAVHHLFGEGWMWQIKFDNDVTSCGIVKPNLHDRSPKQFSKVPNNLTDFLDEIKRYPSLSEQFESARLDGPELRSIRRIQHLYDCGSGRGWSSLPNTIGFVDPLHSKGLAHAFSGVYRLGKVFERHVDDLNCEFENSIERLTSAFRSEIVFLDRLISICYESIQDFNRFRLATFWYFIAATSFEIARSQDRQFDCPFLFSDNQTFCERLFEFHHRLTGSQADSMTDSEFESLTRRFLVEFDQVGLFDPAIPNMYAKTAAPEKSKNL